MRIFDDISHDGGKSHGWCSIITCMIGVFNWNRLIKRKTFSIMNIELAKTNPRKI